MSKITLEGLWEGDYSPNEIMHYINNLVAEVERLKQENLKLKSKLIDQEIWRNVDIKLIKELKEVLKKCKEYIEEKEDILENEWGSCRSLSTLIEGGEMPDLYDEIIKFIGGEGE